MLIVNRRRRRSEIASVRRRETTVSLKVPVVEREANASDASVHASVYLFLFLIVPSAAPCALYLQGGTMINTTPSRRTILGRMMSLNGASPRTLRNHEPYDNYNYP